MQDFSQEHRSLSIDFLDVTYLDLLAFASKILTPTKQCYANVEREMIAVIFGLEKFKYYTLGYHTLVLNDCKPLSSITSKGIMSAPPHL